MSESLAPRPTSTRARILLWASIGTLVVADAVVSTPVGLSLLLVVPLSFAALVLPRREVLAMVAVCSVARILFGPIGDPLHLKGVTFEVSATTQLWIGALGSVATYGMVAFTFDLVARQRRRIARLATHADNDALTGVANRRGLATFLALHGTTAGSVIAVDVDHFKAVNDEHGHAAGDLVLKEVARRLRSVVRGGDLVARAGGEEFVLMLPSAPSSAVERVAGRVVACMREAPFDIGGGQQIAVTVSAGCATGPLGEPLMASADEALYRAKREGRDRFVVA